MLPAGVNSEMTNEEYSLIKDREKKLLDLVKEKRRLDKIINNTKENNSKLKYISEKRDNIEELLDELFIFYEEDVFHRLSREYEDIRSDTYKKLYFLYGFLRNDNTKDFENYIPYLGFDNYFLFVPYDSQNNQYAWYMNIIDMKDYKIIPIEEKDEFERNHYILTRNDISYSDEKDYHKMRLLGYNGIKDDVFFESIQKYRENLFRILLNSSSEEETIKKTYLRYGRKITM